MKKGSIIAVFGFILFLSACGESEKEEILRVDERLHELTDGAEEKIEQAEKDFIQFVEGQIDESEYEETKEEMNEFIEDKKDAFDDIKKPKEDKAIKYYELSEEALMSSFDMIESLMDAPDLTDEDEAVEFGEDLDEKEEKVATDIENVEEFQNELKEEDDDYKDAFDDE